MRNCKSNDVDAELEMYQPPPQPLQQQQPGTAVLYTAAGQPVALTVASQVCQAYKSRQSVACGILLVLSGMLSIVFNIVAMSWNEVVGYIGHGIWCGFLVSDLCALCLYFL